MKYNFETIELDKLNPESISSDEDMAYIYKGVDFLYKPKKMHLN